MTSIRDLLGESLGVGETVRVTLEESGEDGVLVAAHPRDGSPMDIAVVYGLDRLEDRPPVDPVAVEIVGEVVDDRIAGRVVGGPGTDVDADGDTDTNADGINDGTDEDETDPRPDRS